MAEKLVIFMLNSSLDASIELIKPIYHATVSASIDYPVEVIFSGHTGKIALSGVANNISSQRKAEETIYDFKASKFATQKWGDNLIAEISEIISSDYIVGEIINSEVQTLTY